MTNLDPDTLPLIEQPDPYMSPFELKRLTGFTHRTKQQDWLKDGNWPFEVSGDGRILVLREYRDKRMSGAKEEPITAFGARRHNFAALG